MHNATATNTVALRICMKILSKSKDWRGDSTYHLFVLCWCWSRTESLSYPHPFSHRFMHHVHYRTLFRNEPRFKNSLTHLEITHENRWKLQINFYTQIDSYIEQATHFRLERLKFVSLQQSNQSLFFRFLPQCNWFDSCKSLL